MNGSLIQKHFDVVVVGAGLGGFSAAIAAARHGAQTALICDRPMIGGNGSSEVQMCICGADAHGTRPNARETGIVEEYLLRNRLHNLILFLIRSSGKWHRRSRI